MPDSVRFFLDEHIPSAVAVGLRQRDVDVLTVQEAGRAGFPDIDQLRFASEQDRVLVTFDSDYLAFAQAGEEHSGIVWCTQRKYSIGQLIHGLILIHAVLDKDGMRNHVEFL